MLEAVNLTKSYGQRLALTGINLKMSPGEVFCLLGPKGCGKTTMLDLFLGRLLASSGAAKVFGLASSVVAQTRAKLAAVPAGYPLYPDLTLTENLDFFLNASRLPPLTVAQRLDLLKDVGLDSNVARLYARELKPGQRQAAGVGLGLARDARAFLCDEPYRGLTPDEHKALAALLHRVATGETAGEPSVVVTTATSVDDAAGADRIGLLAKGRLAAVVDTRETPEWRDICAKHLGAAA